MLFKINGLFVVGWCIRFCFFKIKLNFVFRFLGLGKRSMWWVIIGWSFWVVNLYNCWKFMCFFGLKCEWL